MKLDVLLIFICLQDYKSFMVAQEARKEAGPYKVCMYVWRS